MKKSILFAAALVCGMAAANAQDLTNGHELVDLGLPSGLKWAAMNVGATAPEGSGDYFAWGETDPKETYSLDTYKWYNNDNFTKYNYTDYKATLDPEDDAASVNWGGAWRMPTKDEWQELIDNCDWESRGLNGIFVYEVKSKTNGNSIFLPNASWYDNTGKQSGNNNFIYWSSSFYSDNEAWTVIPQIYTYYRYCGLPVRPVAAVYTVTVNASENGTVVADKAVALENDEVTLTVAPAEGYELAQLAVKQGETEITVSSDYKSTMSAGDVVVSATFKEKTSTAVGNAGTVGIYAENGRIVCEQDFRIYDLLGRDVTNMNGHLNGIYVVKCGEKATKIVAR